MNAGSEKSLIFDHDFETLAQIMRSWDEPTYRVIQVWQGLYIHFWSRPEQFTILPRELRDKLAERFLFSSLQPSTVLESNDKQTQKILFRLQDGQPVEAVLMRYNRRRTLCISTQSGCAMGCVFCATGQMGFRRHLTSGEIIEQVLYYGRYLSENGEKISNVVVMGMGEPFHNYEATMQAIDRLNHSQGLNLSARRFTVSTVGLVPAIRRFADEKRQVNLAISLHAASDELRSQLLPLNHKYPLDELFAACLYYVEQTRRRLTFEWALIQGLNDSSFHAEQLAERLRAFRLGKAMLCHVNIIPLNPTQGYAGKATARQQAQRFQGTLESRGIPCSIRLRRGIDIQAGCGQLAVEAKYE